MSARTPIFFVAKALFYGGLAMVVALGPSPSVANTRASATSLLQSCARALDAWQLEDAMAAAAQLLMEQPNSLDARALAAEVMHQRGQHLQALALLGPNVASQLADDDVMVVKKQALRMPDRLDHFLPQLQGSARYAPQFVSIDTRHFRIFFQDKDELMAHYAKEVLEAAYQRIGADLDAHVSEGDEPIVVEIYPTVAALAQATGLTEQEIETSGTIAVCKFHRLMVVSALATVTGYPFADTLAHELTHLMVSKRSHNNVPIWLHEGIAKYFESRWRTDAGRALTAHSEALLSRAAQANTLIPFARMHPSMAKLPNQRDAALAFAEVFAMVQMLVEERGPSVIARALKNLGRGEPFDKVMVQTFGGSIPTLERKLHAALKKRRTEAWAAEAAPVRIGAMAAQDGAIKASVGDDALSLTDGEARALLRLGELLLLRQHDEEATEPLQRAYDRAGAQLPGLGLKLARTLVAQQQFIQATKVLTETLAVHPDLIEAHKLLAELMLRDKKYGRAADALRSYCLHNPFNESVHLLWAQALTALGQQEEATIEARFARIAAAPRSPQSTPEAPAGSGMLSILTNPWGTACIDDGTHCVSTPAWRVPVAPGTHTISARAAQGQQILEAHSTIAVAAGEVALWQEQLRP